MVVAAVSGSRLYRSIHPAVGQNCNTVVLDWRSVMSDSKVQVVVVPNWYATLGDQGSNPEAWSHSGQLLTQVFDVEAHRVADNAEPWFRLLAMKTVVGYCADGSEVAMPELATVKSLMRDTNVHVAFICDVWCDDMADHRSYLIEFPTSGKWSISDFNLTG